MGFKSFLTSASALHTGVISKAISLVFAWMESKFHCPFLRVTNLWAIIMKLIILLRISDLMCRSHELLQVAQSYEIQPAIHWITISQDSLLTQVLFNMKVAGHVKKRHVNVKETNLPKSNKFHSHTSILKDYGD